MKKNKIFKVCALVTSSAIAVVAGYFAYQIINVAISTNPDKMCQIE